MTGEQALFEQSWQGPAILLVDLDAFFASVEQLDHPAWKGKPVIVGGDPTKHGVVSTASYEARAFGVRSAMPASTAHELCPNAFWTHGHFDRYHEVSRQVMDILRDETPHVQQVSIDEAFMDVSPTAVNREHPVRIAQRIQRRVGELGVTCSIGVGTSKTIAKIASDMDKPRGLTVVYPGREQAFLAPLPVRAMSGVGAAAEKQLKAFGIRTLADMAAADEGVLKRVFGKNADMMRMRSRGGEFAVFREQQSLAGKDLTSDQLEAFGLSASESVEAGAHMAFTPAPFASDEPVKSVSHEMTFAEDVLTTEEAVAALASLAAKVGRRLRKKNLRGHTLMLKVRFHDRSNKSVQRTLPRNTNDELGITPLLREMLAEVWAEGMAIRLLGVAVSGFDEPSAIQESLFDANALEKRPSAPANGNAGKAKPLSAEKRQALIQATDAVKDRFGEAGVLYGREMRVSTKSTGTGAKNPLDT